MEHLTGTEISTAIAGTAGFWFFFAQLLFKTNDSKSMTILICLILQMLTSFIGWFYTLPFLMWTAPWLLLLGIVLVYYHRPREPELTGYEIVDETWDDL
ncbi:MAG: hypothetical protein ACI92I_000777 [Acidimicrobiales bacterium]|jgi:hypothetical protein